MISENIENPVPWVETAKSYLGLSEIKGKEHAPEILNMLEEISDYPTTYRAFWSNDEMPWCGTFVAYCLIKHSRYVVPEWYRAKEWANSDEMTELEKPAYGSIVVFNRKGGGHVGIVVGETKNGKLMVIGGNQNDEVNISKFKKSRVLGYYWPSKYNGEKKLSRPYHFRYDLPLYKGGILSTNEA